MRFLLFQALPTSLLLLALAAGCGEPRADTPQVAAAPVLRQPFELYGHPGPWWREGAVQTDFDVDVWNCRTESKQARQEAPKAERKDAAYRSFLDCMSGRAWTRGYPPAATGG